ncbi:aldehyde dehydrogenase family protein [Streptomyces sp. NBC_00878]|uniref:aldehyde dehydrogenase family protein n=1 Tax=Streptomyces sp. NBC_00878 TaxID=2975854 RepID=UPI002254DE85|nr:aldehyde dehydrogenase family protein [Streptomyces sp. NBC_00878]MCX4910767.1 aldehyde dehydrogenase family protein [Streptomyces sp. NBC_00878]
MRNQFGLLPLPLPVAGQSISGNEVLGVRSPYSGEQIAEVATASVGDALNAVHAAHASLTHEMPAWRRAEVLDAAARLVEARADHIAELMVGEVAKPIRLARIEVQRAADTFRFSADEARRLSGSGLPLDAAKAGVGMTGFTVPGPVGVVGGIIPFNFPAVLTAHKLGPAIAAGCPIVLLLSNKAPLAALALTQCAIDAGLPADRVSVLVGDPGPLAEVLLTDDRVRLISFTGSAGVGWGLQRRAQRKRVLLELGNMSPIVVCADGDVVAAARAAAIGGNLFAGQSCISVQRLVVDSRIAEEFEDALLDEIRRLRFGDPSDPATDLGPMITQTATQRMATLIGEAEKQGGVQLTGGLGGDGHLRPTVLRDVDPAMEVWSKEAFAPLLSMRTFDDLQDAFALANKTEMAIHASIFTRDIGTAMDAVRAFDFAGVIVNEGPSFRVDQMPYGGIRGGGNTKEGPHYAVEEMTLQKLVAIRSVGAKSS